MSPEDKVRQFFAKYRTRTYKKGSVLLMPGDIVHDVFYLEKGTIGQYAITDSGNKIMVTTYKAGAFLPMLSAIDNTPNRFYFEASTQDIVVRLAPVAELLSFIRADTDILYDLLHRMYRGLDGVIDRLIQHMSGSAEARLRVELMIMAQRFGTEQADGTYEIIVTDQELAAQSGMARETVSRAMADLKARGIVSRVHKGINIDISKLSA